MLLGPKTTNNKRLWEGSGSFFSGQFQLYYQVLMMDNDVHAGRLKHGGPPHCLSRVNTIDCRRLETAGGKQLKPVKELNMSALEVDWLFGGFAALATSNVISGADL